jgi:hypothetical protein
MDGARVNLYFRPLQLATQRARGQIDPVPRGVNKIGRLEGTPCWSRIAKYHPVKYAGPAFLTPPARRPFKRPGPGSQLLAMNSQPWPVEN